MKAKYFISRFCIAVIFMAMFYHPGAWAATAPVNDFDETIQVEGQNLTLNGYGPLAVNRVKIYNIGLYLPEKKTAAPDILALPGVIRIRIKMLKSVESEMMSRRFIADVHANTSKDERLKIANDILALGMGFNSIGDWDVNDVMTIDWIPGKGMIISWNKKQVSEPFKNGLLMQAILKIWIGDNVFDSKLKKLLLGVKD